MINIIYHQPGKRHSEYRRYISRRAVDLMPSTNPIHGQPMQDHRRQYLPDLPQMLAAQENSCHLCSAGPHHHTHKGTCWQAMSWRVSSSSGEPPPEDIPSHPRTPPPGFSADSFSMPPRANRKTLPRWQQPQNEQNLVFQRIHSIYNIVIAVQIKRIRSFLTIYRLNSFYLSIRIYLQ